MEGGEEDGEPCPKVSGGVRNNNNKMNKVDGPLMAQRNSPYAKPQGEKNRCFVVNCGNWGGELWENACVCDVDVCVSLAFCLGRNLNQSSFFSPSSSFYLNNILLTLTIASIIFCNYIPATGFQQNPFPEEQLKEEEKKIPLRKTNACTLVISRGRQLHKNYKNTCPWRERWYEPTFYLGMMVVQKVVLLWNMVRWRRHILPWQR